MSHSQIEEEGEGWRIRVHLVEGGGTRHPNNRASFLCCHLGVGEKKNVHAEENSNNQLLHAAGAAGATGATGLISRVQLAEVPH